MEWKLPASISAAALLFAGTGTGGGPAGAEATCSCAATSPGWLLFEDSNTRTPDFWLEDAVVVQEIAACTHGIEFRFVTDDSGVPYLTALFFANPLARLSSRRNINLARDLQQYSALRTALNRLLPGALAHHARLDFRSMPLDERPRIIRPWSDLALAWQGSRIELRGCLDVYMTLLP